MKVERFALRIAGGKSFFARVDNGKLVTVADAFCVLDSGPLPVCVGMCSLDAELRFDRVEEGAKKICVSFVDLDGRLVMPGLETTIDVKLPDQAPTAAVPFAFLMRQLSLPAFGEYRIELAVDGRQEASAALYVRQKA